MSGTISKDAHVFKGPLIKAVGSVGAFWGIIGTYPAVLAFVILDNLHTGQIAQRNGIPFVLFLVGWFLLVLALFPGRLMASTPYAVALEPPRGIWVFGPPKVWIPFDEVTGIGTYSSWFGRLHVVELSRSHGLVKRVHLFSLISPDELANELRSSIDRRGGVQPAK
ncbi:MAG: hypothetical protein ABSG77_13060 [Candidatus Acidiferrum sp.]